MRPVPAGLRRDMVASTFRSYRVLNPAILERRMPAPRANALIGLPMLLMGPQRSAGLHEGDLAACPADRPHTAPGGHPPRARRRILASHEPPRRLLTSPAAPVHGWSVEELLRCRPDL